MEKSVNLLELLVENKTTINVYYLGNDPGPKLVEYRAGSANGYGFYGPYREYHNLMMHLKTEKINFY